MTQGNNVVYVGGDSFTAGDDIADHFLPDYSEDLCYGIRQMREMHDQAADIMKVIDARDEYFKRKQAYLNSNFEIKLEWIKWVHEHRWSNVLGKLINLPVFNISSFGGSGTYAIGYRACYDINDLQKRGYNVSHVIIQMTAPGRLTLFTGEDSQQRQHCIFDNSKMIYYFCEHQNVAVQTDALAKEYLKKETMQFLMYRYLYEIYTMEMSLRSIVPNAEIIFVDSIFHRSELFTRRKIFEDLYWYFKHKHQTTEQDNFLLEYARSLEKRIELAMIDCATDQEETIFLPTAHVKHYIHERFAHRVFERYFKDYAK